MSTIELFDYEERYPNLFLRPPLRKKSYCQFEQLFRSTPELNGSGWETLLIEEIVIILKEAGREIFKTHSEYRQTEILSHTRRSRARRWFDRTLCGWKTPPVVTEGEILVEMAELCRTFANWVERNYPQELHTHKKSFCFLKKPRMISIAIL